MLLVLGLALAACGGSGSDDDETPEDDPAPYQLLSTRLGHAELENLLLAFAGNGDGMALWEAYSGQGVTALVYAAYSAASDSWSADRTLASTEPGDGSYDYAWVAGDSRIGIVFEVGNDSIYASVFENGEFAEPELLDEITGEDLRFGSLDIAARGDDFAAIWRRDETYYPATSVREAVVRGSTLSGGSTWTAAQTLSAAASVSSLTVASDGAGYLALWLERPVDGGVTIGNTADLAGRVYANGAWEADPLSFDVDVETDERSFAVASNGTGYQLAWIKDDGTARSAFGRALDAALDLLAIQPLEAVDEDVSDLAMIAGDVDYLAAWRSDPSPESLTVTVGGGASWAAPVTLDSEDEDIYQFELASNGSGFAVLWPQKDGSDPGSERSAWASVYDGSWSAAEKIESSTGRAGGDGTLGLLFDGSDFVAAWVEETVDSTGNLLTNAFSGGAWGPAEPLAELADTHFSFDNPLPFALQGNRASTAWFERTGDDGPVAVNVATRNGAWADPVDVATTPRGFSVESGQLISNDAGQTLALWHQLRAGKTALYAALQNADGDWGAAELLNLGRWGFEVAASATAFAVVYDKTDPISGANRVLAHVRDGSGWSAPANLGDGLAGDHDAPALATDGSGFAVAWRRRPGGGDPPEIYAATWAAGNWAAPTRLDNIAADYHQSPSIASNGTGYAVTWDRAGPTNIPLAIYDGADWQPEQTVASPASNSNLFPSIASDGSGYLLFWVTRDSGDTNNNAYAATSPTGAFADFSSPQRLSDDSFHAGNIRVASDGTGYAATWHIFQGDDASSLLASVWDGANWSAQIRLDSGAEQSTRASLVAGDTGYAVLYRESGATRYPTEHYVRIHDGADWNAAELLYTQTGYLGDSEFGDGNGQLASNGDGYATTWIDVDSTDGNPQVHFASYDGAQWSSRAIEDQDGRAAWSVIAGAGEGYTVLWAQPQPGGDPLVALPWVYPGLE